MSKRDIDIAQFRAFLAIAEEGTFRAASRLLDCSQATVTLRIQRLERRLRVRLCERGGNAGVRLTAAGRELLPEARAFVELYDGIVRRSQQRGGRFW